MRALWWEPLSARRWRSRRSGLRRRQPRRNDTHRRSGRGAPRALPSPRRRSLPPTVGGHRPPPAPAQSPIASRPPPDDPNLRGVAHAPSLPVFRSRASSKRRGMSARSACVRSAMAGSPAPIWWWPRRLRQHVAGIEDVIHVAGLNLLENRRVNF